MKKISFFLFLFFIYCSSSIGQTGTDFWFAAPEVTAGHNDAGPKFRFTNTSSTLTANVTVTFPAQPLLLITPTPIVIAPNGTATLILDANPNNYKAAIENTPTNTVLNKGIHITSDVPITAYYEVDNSNNNEIFALKGANGLGTEFYIPMTTNPNLSLHTPLVPSAAATFDIVATQDNTTVQIYTRVPVDGHPANVPFTIILNTGQTYSCGWTGANFQLASTHPSGSVVLSDKPIAITVKEDFQQHSGWGCYDLIGDQIVPVDIIGTDYIIIKGQLNATAGESFYILATQNNTNVYVNGNPVPVATLFAGQTYFQDNIALNRYYIQTDKPVYCTQGTGFGCEHGSAILPPLNCAGSATVSFVRSTNESFYLNIMVKAGNEGNFTLTGGSNPLCITAGDFAVVPGTGGQWMSTYAKSFTLAEVPVGVAMRLTNSTDVFGMGLINGGAATGCRYGFFSEFAAAIVVDAGPNQTICSDVNAQLAGSVSGGATTGIWTTSGSGMFTPNNTTLNAQYVPSINDINNGSVILTLTSTSVCFPVSDQVTISIQAKPVVNAGVDQSVCSNNPNFTLNGAVANAVGGVWSGGAGFFSPNNTALNAVYTPTIGEILAGSLTLTLTSTGNGVCNPVADAVLITFTPSPTVNAGLNQTVCANNPNVSLNGNVTVATGGVWTGGAGSYSPSNTALGAVYTPSLGEITAGTVTLTLTSTGNGNCLAVSDNMTITITPAPIVNAGLNQVACSNNPLVTLNGSVVNATGGQWTGGLGLFLPNSTTLNATYTPTGGELLAGNVTLTLTSTGNGSCNPVSDNMIVSYTPSPTANAGIDQAVCANNPNATLNGTITVATGGMWSGGSGTYNPNNTALNAVYTPSGPEITAGTVTLTLTTTGNGTCNAVSDNVTITISPSPIVNAGPNTSSCINNPSVVLNGSVINATGGIWSGGAGVYNPNNTDLNATYTPSVGEILAGTAILTLTSTGNGNCLAVSDNMTITINPSPTANAGADQVVCSNNPSVTLNGSVFLAAGGQWSGGLGIFTPNNSALNAVYTPTIGEILSGSLTLTLTTTGNGNCNPATDNMTITYTPSPTTDAGPNQTVCGNNANVTLNGVVVIATGGIWSGGLGTYAPNNTSLNAIYTPTPGEIAAGTVTLTLTSTGNGNCLPVSDNVVITITPAPIVNAGSNQTVCVNNSFINLNGIVMYATGGQWSGGLGSYNPSNTDLNAVYTPTPGELLSGSLTLTLTSTGNGSCLPVSDNMTVTFTPSPTANAGPDQILCSNNANFTLNGVVTLALGGQWSGGLGSFFPNNTALNAVYTPTLGEIAFGSVTLTLTTTGNGSCNAVSDNMTVSFTPSPTADAGADQIVCTNNPNTSLIGTITVATGGIWSGGTGTYIPNNTTLIITYIPSPAEITAGFADLTLTTTGNGNCTAVSDVVHITINPPPIVNAGADIIACVNNPSATLNGSIQNSLGGIWSGGAGVFNPNSTTLNAVYTPTPGEILSGSVTLTLTSTGNGNCLAVTDQVTITFSPSPIVDAGVNQTVCGNNSSVSLSGSVINAAGGQWTGGLGIYVPNSNTLNATYTPTMGEILAGNLVLTLTSTGNGTCNAVTDNMTIFFTPSPTANAGVDQSVCANNPTVSLSGFVTIATGGIWSGGTGTYNPNNTSLNTSYTPSPSEISAGSVTLTLTTTGNGNCNPVSDNILITITPSPTANAGIDKNICKNNPDVALHGIVTIATGGVWSGGAGVYNPNNLDLNAVYTPTIGEINAGSLTLTLTTTGNGNCNAVSDNMTINFTPIPIVNAGVDQVVCANTSINLFGTVFLASGGIWSGGLGLFSPSNTALNAVYTPTMGEILAGNLNLTLTSTGNGTCNPVSDIMNITFTPAPTSNAGTNQTVCGNNASVSLNGQVTIATGGLWSTSGTGSFTPNNTTLNAIYTPSPNDITNGSVNLYLTTTGNGNCNPVIDSMTITITPAPVVDAGSDQTVCVDNLLVPLNGSVTGGSTTGIWTTNGTGTFIPNNTMLSASYLASSLDSANFGVTLTLTSTSNGNCLSEFDTMHIFIFPAGIANAGNDVTVCANNASVPLNGSISGGAITGIWSTTGTGTFTPNVNTLNATYHPSNSDTANGSVILVLTANSCDFASDSITITISPAPYVNAGPDIFICSTTAPMNGTISGGTTTGLWSTSGTGTFSPNNTDPLAIYNVSIADSLAGSVTLVLTSTNNGNCITGVDTVIVTITTAGFVNAGLDQTVCDNALVNLSGQITGGASQGIWTTSGTGTFTPNDTALNATYHPSGFDILAGNVMLTLTATNSCNVVFDNVLINFIPSPTVSAGADQIVCANNSVITLNGTVNNTSSLLWTTSGSGTFTPNNTSLNVMYIPSPGDISAGNVTIYLTGNGNGSCSTTVDSMLLQITPSPNVNAGFDQSVCVSTTMTMLMGSVSGGATTGMWTTLGSGNFIPDNLTMNAFYQYSNADTAAGYVDLVLTSTNNGSCMPVSDTVHITFGNTTYVYAGPDQTLCGGISIANLDGFVTGGSTTGIWVTLGSGSFFPDDTTLNASYVVSNGDSINGSVDLILISTNNGACNAGSDTLTIYINKVPIVDAGNNITACYGGISTLNGSVQFASGGQWTSSGTGTFVPDNITLNAQYIPSYSDSINGQVSIILTSTGTSCPPVSDTMIITYIQPVIPDFISSVACINSGTSFIDNSNVVAGSISSWLWDFGGGNLANTQNAAYVFTTLGNHLVSLTVQSSLGCTFTIVKTVFVNPSPIANYTNTTVCAYAAVDFTDGSSVTPGAITDWSWNFGDGSIDSIANPVHFFNNDTTYSVTLVVTSDAGCVDSISNNVIFYPGPIANFASDTIACAHIPIQFTDFSTVSGGNINSWIWDFGNSTGANIQNPSGIYLTGGSYFVTLIVQSNQGCRDTVVKPITISNGPTADFTYSGDMVTGSGILFTNTSIGDENSNWDFGDGIGTSTVQNPQYTYDQYGNYMVTLIVQDLNNCSDTAWSYITVALGNEIYPPKVPTGFSPNGDGQNDTLFVRGGPFSYLEFKIFNKWGKEIFNSNAATIGWDGTWNNFKQPLGVYTYTVIATTVDGIEYKKSGNVTLIR